MGLAFYLIALGVGYFVFLKATLSGKKSLKQLGRLIGVFIMVLALMGTLCKGLKMVKYSVFGGSCGYSQSSCCGKSSYGKCCSKHGGGSGKQCPFSSSKSRDS